MLTHGRKVLILDAVDARRSRRRSTKANTRASRSWPTTGWRPGPIAAYVSFDNEKVGKLQGTALLNAIKAGGDPKRGKIVMINGSPDRPERRRTSRRARTRCSTARSTSATSTTPRTGARTRPARRSAGAISRSAPQGHRRVRGQRRHGRRCDRQRLKAARCQAAAAGDRSGRRAGRRSSGSSPATSTMTIYKAIKPQAEAAAEMAVALGSGKPCHRRRPRSTTDRSRPGEDHPGRSRSPRTTSRTPWSRTASGRSGDLHGQYAACAARRQVVHRPTGLGVAPRESRGPCRQRPRPADRRVASGRGSVR